ncbi:MAG: YqgE/AlgH family protein [Gammaproteobacteria bacterium]|nr:MAG: YqgE/AlgH family protein [Gammaproteobacteria bacterium]
MTKFPSLKDHFLIAMPNLTDPNFFQSVTYVIEHNEEGAMGIVINHPLEVDLKELFDHLSIEVPADFAGKKKIMAGGPVQVERGFIIHSPPGNWESTIKLSNDIAVTTSQDILTAISKDQGPDDVELILGYAGWGAGQLDQEILENSWLSVPSNSDILFHTPAKDRWKAAAKLIGVDINQLSAFAGHS